MGSATIDIDRILPEFVKGREFESFASTESVGDVQTILAGKGMVDIAMNVIEGSLAASPKPHQATVIGQRTTRVPALYTITAIF